MQEEKGTEVSLNIPTQQRRQSSEDPDKIHTPHAKEMTSSEARL